jgi:glucose-1-phosphate adenylyltransferase
MDRVATLLLAGGRGLNFGALSEHRPKAALPVGGYYRIIDFALSNLSHSGVRQVGIIIQFLPASLMEHVGSGRPWDFDMADRNLRYMIPFVGVRETRWFHGTGDAIKKNINLLDLSRASEVMIVSADHVYRMNYQPLIDQHREDNADVTIACVEMPEEQQHPRFGNLILGDGLNIESFIEKPQKPLSPLVSMGIYVFKKEVLLELLEHSTASGDEFSLSGDVIQPNISKLNARACICREPWYYLGSAREYFDFHMQLARGEIDLFQDWDVMTNFSDRNLGSRPPAYIAPGAMVENAIISPGCKIEGSVSEAVLSPGVMIGPGASVRSSIIFHDVQVGAGAVLEHALIDKDVVVEPGARIGTDTPAPKAGEKPDEIPITIIAKGQIVRAGRPVTVH